MIYSEGIKFLDIFILMKKNIVHLAMSKCFRTSSTSYFTMYA